MARENTFNFSAGPSVMPESVLKAAQKELLDYKGTGMSVMEMSHRSPMFQEIFDNAKSADNLAALHRQIPLRNAFLALQTVGNALHIRFERYSPL